MSADESLAQVSTVTNEQAMELLFERHGRKSRVGNERKHQRLAWVSKITVWLRKDRWDIPREVNVKTQDVSRGGFSFLHAHFLHLDTLVSTRFDSLPNRPILTGVIRSCVYVGEGEHRIGVEFISSASSEDDAGCSSD